MYHIKINTCEKNVSSEKVFCYKKKCLYILKFIGGSGSGGGGKNVGEWLFCQTCHKFKPMHNLIFWK